jgi:type II pantothenate kinase
MFIEYLAAALAATYVLYVRRTYRPNIKHANISNASMKLIQQGRRKLLTKLLDMGNFFGIDIGGSLTKLVFFQPDDALVQKMLLKSPDNIRLMKFEAIKGLGNFILSSTVYGQTGIRDDMLSFHISELGGTFHFIRFETRRISGALKLAKKHGLHTNMSRIHATGGGAIRFFELAQSMLDISLESLDEIDCLVKGIAFLINFVENETFTFEGKQLVHRAIPNSGVLYPYLLVNIGSGTSIIVVKGESEWERVGGTSLGGGTYYGLVHMLTGLVKFDDMLNNAEEGDNTAVDLTVGDIYGGSYSKFNLKANTIASSFGKAITWVQGSDATVPLLSRSRSSTSSLPANPHVGSPSLTNVIAQTHSDVVPELLLSQETSQESNINSKTFASPEGKEAFANATSAQSQAPFSPASPLTSSSTPPRYDAKDISRALLLMISNDIGQIAYLHALRHKCKAIYFAGNFLRHDNTIAMRTLAYAIQFWSKGELEGLFLKHEGYGGALGAFLATLESSE